MVYRVGTSEPLSDGEVLEQLSILHRVRVMLRNRVVKKLTLAGIARKLDIDRRTLQSWSENHCIDPMIYKPRSWLQLRHRITEKYGPWVSREDIRDTLFPNDTVNRVSTTLSRWKIKREYNPWLNPPPIIPFRDIVHIAKLIQVHESMLVVREKSGYSLLSLIYVFHITKNPKTN